MSSTQTSSMPRSSTSGLPAGLELNNASRQVRPAHPHRQSSYTKRHASFDTPREVPLPAEPVGDALGRLGRLSPTRNSRDSSASLSDDGAQPLSPNSKHTPQDSVSGPLNTTRRDKEGDAETEIINGGGASDNPMTYVADAKAGWKRDQDYNEDVSLSKGKGRGRDYQLQSDNDNNKNSLPTPYPPSKSRDGIYSPSLALPSSSTLSLPLPSHLPFFALPTDQSPPKQSSSHLPRVVEQVPSYFDSNSHSTTMDSTSPKTMLQRRASSSPPSNSLSALFESADRHGASVAAAATSAATTSGSHSSLDSSLGPSPPTVHTPPPQPNSTEGQLGCERTLSKEAKRHSAPYEPFLSHAPPPADSYITVCTPTDAEYRLIVRLPGYSRDCIMLSTRQRRILNIAADSWEAGGGHFERRISFGYDADLTHVRAEFDGEHLRVLIPRKVIWFGNQEKA